MMKKTFLLKPMLLLFAMIVGVGSVWGETVTFTAGTDTSEGTSITKDGITVSFSSGVFNRTDNYRCYSGASMTISSTVGTMTQIDFEATSSNPMTKFSGDPDVGQWNNDNKTQWVGSATEINFGTTSGQARITKITVTYTPSGDTPTPVSTYTVTYDGNGATSGNVPTDDTEYDADNNTVTVLGNTGNLAKEHYSFNGWNTKADGTGTGYVAGNTFTISANTTLFAQWAGNTHSVTLPADDTYGSYSMNVESPVAYGTEVTLTYTPATDYENYQATWSVNGTTLEGNTFTMPDEDVTVTVAVAEVLDYATLPFSWAGGTSADLVAVQGVSAYGLGGDYAESHTPYRVKFDETGDYIQIKTDGQPGKVSIGVKMIGGNASSSITVQGSSNGEDFTDIQTLNISGSQNDVLTLETTNAFAATDRYVRLVFNKGSNVGVGPITIAIPSTDPEIVADAEVELAADATSGEIAYTINNLVAGVSLTATTTAEWISNVTVAADKVTFTTTANEGAERTATLVLTYGEYETKEISITQAAYVAPLTAVTDKMWTFEDWENGDIAATTIIDNLEVNAASNKKISIDENSKSIDGYNFTKRLKLGGSGSTTERNVHFKVAGNSTITVYGMSGSSGTERTIQINIGDKVVESLVNDGNAIGKVVYNYTGEETDVYVYSQSSGNNIYGIKVEPYDASAPTVTAEKTEVDVEAEGGQGTIGVTYNNITDIVADVAFYEADGTTEADYSWITASVNETTNNVEYVVDPNTEDARTAYMKVYALVGDAYVYSDLISITQAKYVAPFEGATYTLATSITPGKNYIIVSDVVDLDGTAYAMGGQNNNNRAAVVITVDGTTAQVSSADVREFVISISEGSENYTIYDAIEEGYLYASSSSSNQLKTQATLNDNGKWKITFGTDGVASIVAQGTSTRNVMQYNSGSTLFACYASASQSHVYLYEKVEDTESVTATISEYKWSSFSSDKAVDFTGVEGLSAYIVTGAEGNTITTEKVDGAVKAGTGLLLYSETAGSFEIPVAEEGTDFSNTNKLVAVMDDMTLNKAEGDFTNYVLALNNAGDKLVFAYINNTPARLVKGQAYLTLEGAISTAPVLSIEGGEATGINPSLTLPEGEDSWYDLSGRRVEHPTKGVFIKNGKKVLVP